ncbi:MAG: 4-(cytidine 5'-diphospho)-2-C-methyl-D-erythritol kinase [Spirochaetota bacterium]
MRTDEVELSAPAKINIHLEVGGNRPDGFHELRSLFTTINLVDTVVVRAVKQSSFSCTIRGCPDIPDTHNTMYLAAREFCRQSGFQAAVTIECTKRIPSGAGLGGGSSDGAAVLRGLNTIFDTALSPEQLHAAATAVGSDVPFFLSSSPAYVTGRGEITVPFNSAGRMLYGVVMHPHFTVSTREAYRELDAARNSLPADTKWELSAKAAVRMYAQPCDRWLFSNAFSPLLYKQHRVYSACEHLLRSIGAAFVSITGSGAAIYGLSEHTLEPSAKHIRQAGELGCRIFTIKTLAD